MHFQYDLDVRQMMEESQTLGVLFPRKKVTTCSRFPRPSQVDHDNNQHWLTDRESK